MKDFLKIFILLCGFVGVFLFGRNYGEQTFKQSDEYKNFIKEKDEQSFFKNDFENAKAKLQNIIDSSTNKKSDEILAQILQVFLADLGIRIQNQNKLAQEQLSTPAQVKTVDEAEKVILPTENHHTVEKKEKFFDYKKMKSYEWILTNATDSEDLQNNLKNVEIKDLDTYLKGAIETKPQQQEAIFGSYRGRIIDVIQKEYGTLAVEIAPLTENEKMKLKGSIKIFKNGKETTSKGFTTTQLGYHIEGSSAFIIDNGNTYFQLYKVPETQQIAGYYYERLVNGTTKTIGSFVLNRVDQF